MTVWKNFFRVLTKELDTIKETANGLDFIKNNYTWDNNTVGNTLKDNVPNWWNEKRSYKKPLIARIKRSIICCHPLELNSEQ